MRFLLLIGAVTLHIGCLEAGNFVSGGFTITEKLSTQYYEITDEDLRGLKLVTDSASVFESKFLQNIQECMKGDKVYSAISVWMVLSMLYYGAQGSTEAGMREVLKISQNDLLTQGGYKALISGLVSDGKTLDLRLANKIFLRTNVHPTKEYTDIIRNSFRSEVGSIKVSDPMATSQEINTWCARQTNDCITDIIRPDSITPSTAIVLVNAVYFKGEWLHMFDRRYTTEREFHVGNETKFVPMMYQSNDYSYGEIERANFKYVVLPFKTKHKNLTLSMIVMLPNEENGLPALHKELVNIDSESLLTDSQSIEVDVFLPKFKIESQFQLDEPLKRMGFGGIFQNADFGKIGGDLSVSNAVQKAFISVDEAGAEAAAATEMTWTDGCGDDESVSFVADHPFAIRIVAEFHDYTMDLFAGQYTGENVVNS